MVQQVHCSRRRLFWRGLEFHVCTINKRAHTKKVCKLIVCTLYLLLEIIITPLCCLIIISLHSRNIYFHLFNFQHILLSSGVNQNVILSIFKSGWLNFLLKLLKIIHFSIGLQFWLSVVPWIGLYYKTPWAIPIQYIHHAFVYWKKEHLWLFFF